MAGQHQHARRVNRKMGEPFALYFGRKTNKNFKGIYLHAIIKHSFWLENRNKYWLKKDGFLSF
jgi:hypothetical protein